MCNYTVVHFTRDLLNGNTHFNMSTFYASVRMRTAAYGSLFVCVCVCVCVCVLLL